MADRSAVVLGVGPTRGLGAAIARRFAREGFRVTVMGRSAEKIEAALADLRAARRRRPRRSSATSPTRRWCDAWSPQADRPDAPLEAAIFNAGGNWPQAVPRHGRASSSRACGG